MSFSRLDVDSGAGKSALTSGESLIISRESNLTFEPEMNSPVSKSPGKNLRGTADYDH